MEWSRFIVRLSNSNKIHWSYLVCLVIFSQVSLFVTAEPALGKNQKPVGKGSLNQVSGPILFQHQPSPPAPSIASSLFMSLWGCCQHPRWSSRPSLCLPVTSLQVQRGFLSKCGSSFSQLRKPGLLSNSPTKNKRGAHEPKVWLSKEALA